MLSLGIWIIPINKEISPSKLRSISFMTDAKIMQEVEVENCARDLEAVVSGNIRMPDEEKCGIFHMTSGSTGEPKFCIRTLYSFMLESASFQKIFTYRCGYKILSLCPLEHSFASGAALFNSLTFGGSLYVMEDFKPKKIIDFINRNLINKLIMVPSMLKIFNKLNLKGKNISSLECVLVGAGIMTLEVTKAFEEKFHCHVYSNYGSSESGCVITSRDEWVNKSAGIAMPGVILKLCDDDYNLVPESDKEGQLYIKCNWMFSGYYKGNNAYTHDGFITLGDIARIDQRGNVFIVGRKESIAKINGRKVSCLEVEQTIMKLPGVIDCKVIGCIKSNNSEYLKAYVVSKKMNEKQLRYELSLCCDHYKIPELIVIVDFLPRNIMGKVLLNELEERESVSSKKQIEERNVHC